MRLRPPPALLPLGLAGVLVAGLAACGGSTPAATGPADTIRVVGPFEIHGVDPIGAQGFFTRLEVAETLVDADEAGVPQPALATQWSTSADGRTWDFDLADDVRFHDGTPLTPEAAVASLRWAQEQPGSILESAKVRRIEATADGVRVRLAEPFAPLPSLLAHTSMQVLAPDSYEGDTVARVIGTGPYEVEEVELPSRIDLVAAEEWRGEPVAIERVAYQTVGRAESRALQAEAGETDVTLGMDPVALQRVKGSDSLDVESVTLPRTIELKANAGHPLLADVRVRQALSLALDREAMTTAVLRDPEMAATQLFPPTLPDWHREDLPPLEHDLEQARELLAEAGWAPGADGVLEKDGTPFEVTLLTFPDRPELPPLAEAIQGQLREVGVAVDVSVGNSSEIPAAHQDGSLQLALFARGLALVPDPLVTVLDDFGPGGSDFGAMGWEDPVLQESLDVLREADAATQEAAERRAQVAEVLQDELPVIPVAWYRQSAVVSPRVDGFELDPLERTWNLSGMSLDG